LPDDRRELAVRELAVARALLDAGTVTLRPDDPVTFKSGLRSPVYVDNRRLIFQPAPWRVVIEAFAAALPPEDVVIAGVESAGIPHSSALAFDAGRPSVFVRKAAKEHGLARRIEGGDVHARRTILVEDMVTTGGSSLSAVEALRGAGAEVTACLAIITYGFAEATQAFAAAGVELTTLTTFEMVVAEALARGAIGERAARLVRAWLADPHAWDDR
jgi:orotate phosphoribosyltransferase